MKVSFITFSLINSLYFVAASHLFVFNPIKFKVTTLFDCQAHGVIEMPNPPPRTLIFEPFIETDEVIFSSKPVNDFGRLMWKGDNEWIEVTVGVVGKHGEMHSLTPSITVKETGDILSLEEKFQGMF